MSIMPVTAQRVPTASPPIPRQLAFAAEITRTIMESGDPQTAARQFLDTVKTAVESRVPHPDTTGRPSVRDYQLEAIADTRDHAQTVMDPARRTEILALCDRAQATFLPCPYAWCSQIGEHGVHTSSDVALPEAADPSGSLDARLFAEDDLPNGCKGADPVVFFMDDELTPAEVHALTGSIRAHLDAVDRLADKLAEAEARR